MAGRKKHPGGRPSSYKLATALMICDRLTERDPETNRLRALREICLDEDMPHEATVYRWLEANDEFREHYVRAREALAEMMANDIVCISDTELDPQRARVRIEARKWWVSKVAPKKYGDKIDVKLDGTEAFMGLWAEFAAGGKFAQQNASGSDGREQESCA